MLVLEQYPYRLMEIYPCFMFTDMEELKMGNVFDENVFESDKLNMILDKLIRFSIKDNNDECNNCIIKEICTGCLGLNSMNTGSPFKLSKESVKCKKDG